MNSQTTSAVHNEVTLQEGESLNNWSAGTIGLLEESLLRYTRFDGTNGTITIPPAPPLANTLPIPSNRDSPHGDFRWLFQCENTPNYFIKQLISPLFPLGELDRKNITWIKTVCLEGLWGSVSKWPIGPYTTNNICIYIILPHKHVGETIRLKVRDSDGDQVLMFNTMSHTQLGYATYIAVRGSVEREILPIQSGVRLMVSFDITLSN